MALAPCFPVPRHPLSLLPPRVTRGRPPDLFTDRLACGLIQTPSPPLPSCVTLGHSVGMGDSNTAFKRCYRDSVGSPQRVLVTVVEHLRDRYLLFPVSGSRLRLSSHCESHQALWVSTATVSKYFKLCMPQFLYPSNGRESRTSLMGLLLKLTGCPIHAVRMVSLRGLGRKFRR